MSLKQGFRWIPVTLKAGIAAIHRQIKEKLLFRDAQELIRKAEPESGKNSISPGEEILYTASIIHELNRFQTQEELLAFRFSREEDAGILLVDCMLHKACILIRSGTGSVTQVRFLLKKIKKLMDSYAKTNSRQVRNYSLTLAWFHTYLDEDIEKNRRYLEKVAEITDIICVSELAKIDEYFSIAANIFLEWGQFDEAAGLLLQSIGICEKHLEITAYARRQLDLLGHLAEVYHFGRHDEKCQAVLTLMETKISKMNALVQ